MNLNLGDTADRYIKTIVVGDVSVGKTSLILGYVHKQPIGKLTSTVGVDFITKILEIDNVKYKLFLWDTAGQEKFYSITKSYYRSVKSALICFSMENMTSFDNIYKYFRELTRLNDKIIIQLVGTFSDSINTLITEEMINNIAEELNVDYFIVSNKTGENVDECFNAIINKTIENELFIVNKKNTEQLNYSNIKKDNCCKLL